VGIGFWRELCRADPALASTNGAEVLDMPCKVTPDAEGFLVLGPN
jgi:hypothetical protein